MSVENVTAKLLEELRHLTTGARDNAYVLAGLKSPLKGPLTAAQTAALQRVGTGLFLGPWSKALLYGVRYWPKAEHRALLQLVAGGRLMTVQVDDDAAGQDLSEWLARRNPSPSEFPYKPGEPSAKAYIVVPSTVEAYLAEADPLAYYRAMADTLRKVGHVNVSIPARGVRKGCSDCFIKEYNHDGPKVPPFELAYAVVAHGRQQFAPVRLEYDDLVAWLERLGARWVTTP